MNRIDLIASLCKSSEAICDIGCDHAQVIVKAIKNYGVKFGYACDIASGPLKQAAINICNHNFYLLFLSQSAETARQHSRGYGPTLRPGFQQPLVACGAGRGRPHSCTLQQAYGEG